MPLPRFSADAALSFAWLPRLINKDSDERTIRLLDLARIWEISFAVEIRRSSTKPGFALIASPIIAADCRSPSAWMIVFFFSSWAFRTKYRARSACCCATCLASTAFSYSGLKLRCVIATSSKRMWKSLARCTSRCRIMRLTSSRCMMSWAALYCATTLFSTSLIIDGNTFSSKSVPSDLYMSGSLLGSGLQRARKEIFTICKSRLPVREVSVCGRARMSKITGLSNQGNIKCKPSR
mmetsp:Transcript_38971/g.81507  ORF Transcript_38971/g.81507 Transcript_38971/m.81507 type:complete len:237 (+) Transcript_38971:271-981(+)